MTEAIEITTFKLANCTCDDFIDASVEIDEWLKRQAGFRSRRLAQWNDGTVVDMLIWDSAAHGRVAMARLMNEMGHSRVHAMIDQPTVSWSVAPVRHSVHDSRVNSPVVPPAPSTAARSPRPAALS